jgi:GH15 family glucan-1,4-alpha-glucosidase
MEDYIRYVTNIAAIETDGRLKPVYPIAPDGSLREQIAPNLAGFRGMGPVRVGNAAAEQQQHDVYGSVVLAAAQMFYDERLPVPGDAALFQLLEKLGEQAVLLALTPDSGPWEYRGRSRIHTYSAVMCWAACDGLSRIALRLGQVDRRRYWRDQADRLHAAILERAWNAERGSFVESLDGTEVDASLLLLAQLGFVPSSDPRFIATVARVERELRHGDLLFRYAFADDFGRPKTAFTICTFWYIEAIAALGRGEEARRLFEQVLGYRNHVGLLAEDIDPATGELWGNFPQTYSMVGLINCAARLSRNWEEGFWRAS